jgi:hypothetical protein
VAAGSEQISTRWIEGAKRECVLCGAPIKNMARDVGVVRTIYPARRREIVCTTCFMAPARKTLGLDA